MVIFLKCRSLSAPERATGDLAGESFYGTESDWTSVINFILASLLFGQLPSAFRWPLLAFLSRGLFLCPATTWLLHRLKFVFTAKPSLRCCRTLPKWSLINHHTRGIPPLQLSNKPFYSSISATSNKSSLYHLLIEDVGAPESNIVCFK